MVLDIPVDDIVECERSFSRADVKAFVDLTDDTQPRHTEPTEDGQLMVPELLTASMVTKLGGQIKLLAHTMSITFDRPFFTGETIRCRMRVVSIERQDSRWKLPRSASWSHRHETVAEAKVTGIIEY